MEIKSAEFITSMGAYADPDPLLPQIAVAGKSNVGKSSLINKLYQRKALAKTSATPGKTRLINLFCSIMLFIWWICPAMALPKWISRKKFAGAK